MHTSFQCIRHVMGIVGDSVKSFRRTIQVGAGVLLLFTLLEDRAWGFAHSWDISEIYSNPDGSVQFIELTNNSSLSGEVFLSGLDITCRNALGTNSFVFPNDLSGSSFKKTFLIATPGFESLPGGVKPDYTFSNGTTFLFLTGTSTIDYDIYDSVTYTGLPTNGVASLVRSGAGMVFSATNSPKNFNNVSNSIVPVMIQSIQQSGNDFILSFATVTGTNGTAGPNYGVEYNNSLTNTNWTNLTNVAGVGATTNVTDFSPSDLQRFYRLRVP